ncbi:MAG TPA: ATP-binding cassette domain-containing protein, partial [Bacteroidota bacterium]|nr:ATP-binding cassette domain-containing protein [Bacteroidota bacterium]
MTDPIINISGISHDYSGQPALHDVSLQIKKGEVFGFLGPNGGGKTTMFKILSTSLRPTSGLASVCGYNVVEEASEVRKHIGVVFQ